MVCVAGTVRSFHSLAGCDVEAFDETNPHGVQSGTNEWVDDGEDVETSDDLWN